MRGNRPGWSGSIDLMGGEISVETREHMGSTFRVELEFEPADAGPEPEYGGGLEDSGQERALSGRRFLVAEDNAIDRLLWRNSF